MMWLAAATVGLIGPHRQANHLGPYTHLKKKLKIMKKTSLEIFSKLINRELYLEILKDF